MATQVYAVWVGQGDCTIIKTTAGTVIMIDCGTVDNQSIYTDNIKPTIDTIMGVKKEFDYLFLTHSDKDHCNLIKKVSQNYTFKKVYFGGAQSQYKMHGIKLGNKAIFKSLGDLKGHYYNMTTDIVDEADFKLRIVCANYPYKKDAPTAPIDDINTKTKNKTERAIYDNNGNSLILLAASGAYKMTFLGDATIVEQDFLYSKLEEDMKVGDIESTVMKMSHHGSKESYSKKLTESAVKPEDAWVSAGITFGHPDFETFLDIPTIQSGATAHDYVAYDEDDREYSIFESTSYRYNTHQKFDEVEPDPTLPKTGTKRQRKAAGKSYRILSGNNVQLTITGGNGAYGFGTQKDFKTSKRLSDVTAKKRRKRS